MMAGKMLLLVLVATNMFSACARRPDPDVVRAQLSSLDFNEADRPLLVAEFSNLSAVGVLERSGRNGTVESWRSSDGVGVALDRGVLVRTMGNGLSLAVSDPAPTIAALAGRGGSVYTRLYKHLTADNQLRETLFTCEMSEPDPELISLVGRQVKTLSWVETCSSSSLAMENHYWTQVRNGVVKSAQWAAPGASVMLEVPVGATR